MPRKLSQVIALEKGTKSRTTADISKIHHDNEKPSLFYGLRRTYEPFLEDDKAVHPPEVKLVQKRVSTQIKEAIKAWAEVFDVTATKDYSNCNARADVVLGGEAIVKDAPVTLLLFLEKRLVDIREFISELPTLDPTHDWEWDEKDGLWVTAPTKKLSTRKVQTSLVLLEPTKEHPGKAEMITQDVPVGEWTTVHQTGAIPITRKEEMKDRVNALLDAVKMAREEANTYEVAEKRIAESILSRIFG